MHFTLKLSGLSWNHHCPSAKRYLPRFRSSNLNSAAVQYFDTARFQRCKKLKNGSFYKNRPADTLFFRFFQPHEDNAADNYVRKVNNKQKYVDVS